MSEDMEQYAEMQEGGHAVPSAAPSPYHVHSRGSHFWAVHQSRPHLRLRNGVLCPPRPFSIAHPFSARLWGEHFSRFFGVPLLPRSWPEWITHTNNYVVGSTSANSTVVCMVDISRAAGVWVVSRDRGSKHMAASYLSLGDALLIRGWRDVRVQACVGNGACFCALVLRMHGDAIPAPCPVRQYVSEDSDSDEGEDAAIFLGPRRWHSADSGVGTSEDEGPDVPGERA